MALLWTGSATAADDPRRPEAFAQQFIDAVTSKDRDRRAALLHSRSRACMNAASQPYFDWIFARQARIVGAGRYKANATPIEQVPTVLPTDGRSDYPVRPSHQVQIDFVGQPNLTRSVVLFVVLEGGQWREVLPCPRGDVAAQARINEAAERRQVQKVRGLSDRLTPALRTELSALLKDGRKVDAIRRYSAATGEDIGTAKGVVESLIESSTGNGNAGR